MGKYVIKGGKKLRGKVKISGAKNTTLKLMAASLLTDAPIILKNTPQINDVYIMGEVLKALGAQVKLGKNTIWVRANSSLKEEAPYELVSQMRASISVLGPLLARLGQAKVALPGGCNIGSRKIDLHLKGLETLGAKIEVEQGNIFARTNVLSGEVVAFDFPSVGATENILMAAVLAKGKTLIKNAAKEPEIVDLANFLNKMGAKIKGVGTSFIEVEGVNSLEGTHYSVIPDRVEAGTFLALAAINEIQGGNGGEIWLEGAKTEHLTMVLAKLKEMGFRIKKGEAGISLKLKDSVKAADIVTLPYPGFPTDLQPQMMVVLSLANGTSIVTENVFDKRFDHIKELNRLGADIRIQGHHAIIRGVRGLKGGEVQARDLRGGAALVLAGLIAQGETVVEDIYHIDRGYENFEQKLQRLGADIERAPYKAKASTGRVEKDHHNINSSEPFVSERSVANMISGEAHA